MVLLLTSMCESCIIESCLPDFKGTYDEDQDELIAVDWNGEEERKDIISQLEIEDENPDSIRYQHRRNIAAQSDEYSERISVLKLRYEAVLYKHHLKYSTSSRRNYQNITINVPKSCSVCFESFKPESDVIGLDCNPLAHVFHWNCMLSWLKKNRSCPLCRKPILYLLPRSIFKAEDLQFNM